MIEHLVIFKWKAGTAETKMTEIEQSLRALKTRVPGVLDLTVGRNFASRGEGHQTGLFVRLESKAALDGYAVHPAHVEVVETLVKPNLEHILVADYEAH